MNSISKVMIALIGGAAAGLATGYLTAPRAGKKSREKLSKEYDITKKSLEQAATKKLAEAKSILNETIEKQAQNGKEVLDKVKKVATFS
ncbi:YtxH domain-containing protein [Reichenbachiella agarivorans]|uniref:YtxH domain-containing protein n=1 Tax=Reichenbachiella agarivorans TaxID=2979464 RepID=A0ABY6CR63_9BACT|nr:YtxH domain-containing protein [Reichenbachiella agarivorans]UXP32530.1 YtxH domain-containing protein [Reichenbachiella agarivorans]